MSKTIAQKLECTKIKRPPRVIYPILKALVIKTLSKKWNTEYEFKVNTKKIKGPFVVVYNHASRGDYVFNAMAFPTHRLNFIAGYNEFFRSHLKLIFKIGQVIPKRNFVPDINTIMQTMRIIKKGGAICIAPEGMNSISGSNQPVALGTGKFLKHLKVPVYSVKIQGAYLMGPKYCLEDRIGKIKVTVDSMFTPQDLEKLTDEQIEQKLNIDLYHDDYEYNKIVKTQYKSDTIAKNMHTYLYKCPTCGKDFTTLGEGNKLYCTECGAGVTFDNYYNMHPITSNTIMMETPKKWYDWQRQCVYREIKANPNYTFTQKVKLGTLPKYKPLKNYATSDIVGEGIITISRNGFTYDGTKNGEPFTFSLSTEQLPTYGMCTDMTRFYTFYQKDFYEFYPETECVAKIFLVTEELHRINGGKWKNLPQLDYIYKE